VINNSAAVQLGRKRIQLYVYSGKLIHAAMYLRRVVIDGRSYAAAQTQVSTVVKLPAPGAKYQRKPAAALLGRCVAGLSKYLLLNLHCGKLPLAAMARTALRLRGKSSAWVSWLPHWPTCMCPISRDDSAGFDSNFF